MTDEQERKLDKLIHTVEGIQASLNTLSMNVAALRQPATEQPKTSSEPLTGHLSQP
jgi:hypothetical protein